MHLIILKGLNQEMREHESSFASEHLRMMVVRNTTLEAKVDIYKHLYLSCQKQRNCFFGVKINMLFPVHVYIHAVRLNTYTDQSVCVGRGC